MNLSLEHNGQQLAFDVLFRKRRTMEIRIEPPNEIHVIVPVGVSEKVILERVRAKADWIVKKLNHFEEIGCTKTQKEYIDGELFLFLGEEYQLKICLDSWVKKPEISIFNDSLILRTRDDEPQFIRTALMKWYKLRASEKILESVNHYQQMFSVKPLGVQVKEQKRKWGCCTGQNKLLFNWRLIMAHPDVLDYVVVHELCHMVVKNHSKNFWNLVETIIPEYKLRRKWLRDNGVRLEL